MICLVVKFSLCLYEERWLCGRRISNEDVRL